MSDSSPLPPVRLRPEAELARDALATPLLSRAARLARWAGPDTRVDADGDLVEGQLPAAAEALGLGGDGDDETARAAEAAEAAEATEDAERLVDEAWQVAVNTGLVTVTDEEQGTVEAGDALRLLTSGSPHDVLDVWLGALETVLAEASMPDPGDMDALSEEADEDGEIDPSSFDWDPEAEAAFLDGVLGNLYLFTVDEDGPGEGPVPLPALAASMIVPDGMGEPTNDMLEQISEALMRLDDQFRLLEPVGLVEFRPVDEELLTETDEGESSGATAGGAGGAAEVDEADVSRYGMVRLTPLGLYGLRIRLLEAGFEAPVVGELADKGADALLDGTAGFPPNAALAETGQWLARREPLAAARELLSAARGADAGGPLRRLHCQQALSLVGQAAEPALREVLDDAELGGLARVWLAERGAADVPAPPESMVFWLTIDTVAAQLAAEGNSSELRELVEGLAAGHSGFFEAAWRVEHPATAEVLEAMGRLHPDKRVAKEARKAAFKARSQRGE
ncbi:hypothetical protein QFZ63_005824 [Streptomyces sp. B3I7]|uniref:hypothetical protein n=1 Tax=Streptomyces sp. B3I7 TaxID=3042269 RepID=UPI00277D67A4|nr:hypothetical protein [Streptomyces sp. B3I7]MDQ0814110.1 hypothetical protein [Streptomyces sp. B3I7]